MRKFDTPVRTNYPPENRVVLHDVDEALQLVQRASGALRKEWHLLEHVLLKAVQTGDFLDTHVARLVLVEALRAKGWLHGTNG